MPMTMRSPLARLSRVEWDRLVCDTLESVKDFLGVDWAWLGHKRAEEMFLGNRWVYACPRCKRTLARSGRVSR